MTVRRAALTLALPAAAAATRVFSQLGDDAGASAEAESVLRLALESSVEGGLREDRGWLDGGKCNPEEFEQTPASYVGKYDPIEKYVKERRQAAEADGWWAQMASLANRVNNFASPVAGWTLERSYDFGRETECKWHQHVAIYTRSLQTPCAARAGGALGQPPAKAGGALGQPPAKPACVLAFSSMMHGSDFATNSKTSTREWCGHGSVQEGYADRMDVWMKSPKFKEFGDYLRDECSKVVASGHSQGGALATLTAFCANRRDPRHAFPFTVDALFTFGTPGVTKESRLHDTGEDGSPRCFRGARFYSQDGHKADPIPAISENYEFKHPLLQTIKLSEDEDSRAIVIGQEFSCDGKDSSFRPTWHWYRPAGMGLHNCVVYIARLLGFGDSDAERYGC